MPNITSPGYAPASIPTPDAGTWTLFFRDTDGAACRKDSSGTTDVLTGVTNAQMVAYAQPLDNDLTAVAALNTAPTGRDILTATSAADLRSKLGLGSASLNATGDFQPIDSDLTAIAALSTTSFGRSFLDRADAAAGRTYLGLGTAATNATGDFQPIDSDLTAIAALTTTAFGRSFLGLADAAAARTLIDPIQPTSMTATPATITTTTETVIHQMTLAANSLAVGTTIRVTCHGIITATAPTITARLKIGTLGTSGDTEVCVTNPAATPVVSGTGWVCEFYVTCRSTGSGGSVLGNGDLTGTAPAKTIRTTTAAVNTTVSNFLSVTLVIGGTAPVCTIVNAFFDTVKQ